VADRLAQVERLDGDPLGGHLVGLAVQLDAGASRARYCSNAVGQSSSVPSSRPIRWVTKARLPRSVAVVYAGGLPQLDEAGGGEVAVVGQGANEHSRSS
jgi:hypothetical protein